MLMKPRLGLHQQNSLTRLHNASLEILNRTGVLVEMEEAADIFQKAGAKVEKEDNVWRVRIPESLVNQALESLPRHAVLHGRIPKHDVVLGEKTVYAFFGEGINVIDLETREKRASTKEDCGNTALICDYYDELGIMERAVASSDKPTETYPLHNAQAIFRNTSKHACIGANSGENAAKMVEMAACCLEDGDFKKRPFLSFSACPTSPLTLGQSCCETILTAAPLGAPMVIISMALSGATAPLSAAATVVQHNAEFLSAMTLTQLVAPGDTCVYGSCSCPINLKTGSFNMSTPEAFFINQSLVELAHSYNLPCWNGVGMSASDNAEPWCCYEYGAFTAMASMGGSDIVLGNAGLDSGMTFDYAKAVMDAEMDRMLTFTRKGMDLSDEALALEVIHQAGPRANFLVNPHTMTNLRKVFTPDALFDRNGEPVVEKAYAKAKEILETHKPAPLPDGADEKMTAIINR